MQFNFKSELWLYPGDGAWVFCTLPINTAKSIKLATSDLPKRGFGSIRITATVNGISWKTSIFPDSKSNSYLLPIKKEIRTKAFISVGDECNFNLQIEDSL